MGGKIKLDDKTQKVISAELDVNYDGRLADAKKDASNMHKLDERVTRTLKGMKISRPLKDDDYKKIASEENAAALVKDFDEVGSQINLAYAAYDNLYLEIRKAEEKSEEELASEADAKTTARIKEIEKQIEALEKERQLLSRQKADLKEEIRAAAKKKSDEFCDELSKIRDDIKTLGEQYDYKVWNMTKALKYIKKTKT
jgi:chromosome segregation ATPase